MNQVNEANPTEQAQQEADSGVVGWLEAQQEARARVNTIIAEQAYSIFYRSVICEIPEIKQALVSSASILLDMLPAALKDSTLDRMYTFSYEYHYDL